jgi:hypothetical protein
MKEFPLEMWEMRLRYGGMVGGNGSRSYYDAVLKKSIPTPPVHVASSHGRLNTVE